MGGPAQNATHNAHISVRGYEFSVLVQACVLCESPWSHQHRGRYSREKVQTSTNSKSLIQTPLGTWQIRYMPTTEMGGVNMPNIFENAKVCTVCKRVMGNKLPG